jgi:integrase
MGERISYGPSFVPGESGIRLSKFSVADQKAVKSCVAAHLSAETAARPKTILRLPDLDQARSRVVREFAAKAAIDKLAPHDLRRTCARLCHAAGGELEQIQFLLGHVSIQTTERYLGCKQRIRSAVNDRIGIEPKGD